MHYSRTLEAWLEATDQSRDKITSIFEAIYGDQAPIWVQRWRMFFMACSELFRYRGGSEWFVSHYLLEPAVGRGVVPLLDRTPARPIADVASTG